MRRIFILLVVLSVGLVAAFDSESVGQEKAKQKGRGKGKGGGLFPPATQVGEMLWVSGAGSSDPKTGKHPEGMEAATRQVMANLKRYMDPHEFTFDDVVASYVWITDMSKYAEMNKAYREVFHDHFPARTTIGVAKLPGGSTVEIALVASKAPKKVITPQGAKNFGLPFSPGILVGDTLYIAGHASTDPETRKPIEGDIKAHVAQALKNIERVLHAADMDFSNVVEATVFLTNMSDYAGMNEAYQDVTKQPLPARVTVGATKIPSGAPVEITMIASRHKGKAIVPEGLQPSRNYSRGLLVGNELYVSGIGSKKETVKEQVDECFERAKKIVEAAGMSMDNLVEARVYLTDLKDYGPMNNAYRPHFTGKAPMRATMAVSQLPNNNKIMMAFVGAKAEK